MNVSEAGDPTQANWGAVLIVAAMLTASFGYLQLAGEQTKYGKGHSDPEVKGLHFVAWDFGWPKRFMVCGLGELPSTHRWALGDPKQVLVFSWYKFAQNFAVAAIVIVCGAKFVYQWTAENKLGFRISQLFVFSAWAATGIAFFFQAEMQRYSSYDKMKPGGFGFGGGNPNAPRNMDDSSDFVRRFWCDSEIMLDMVPTTICFFGMGLFWLYVVDAIFRLLSNRPGTKPVD